MGVDGNLGIDQALILGPRNLGLGIELPCTDRKHGTPRIKTEPPAYNQNAKNGCFL